MFSVVGLWYAKLTIFALRVRATTSSVFAKYVITHHIGRVDISTDSSGIQGDFAILHLNQPIPSSQLQNQTRSLAHAYFRPDQGKSLTIEYAPQGTARTVIQADAVFNPATGILHMTFHRPEQEQGVQIHVNWAAGDP